MTRYLAALSRPIDLDAPRTPYAAQREREQLPIEVRVVRGRKYVLRGEQACILRNARSWRI